MQNNPEQNSKPAMLEKPREISKLPHVPELSAELVDRLTKLCFLPNQIVPSDLIFQFGTSTYHDRPAALINQLLTKQIAPHVIITGGTPNFGDAFSSSETEATRVMNLIDATKFPNVTFTLEGKSVNTLDNVLESKKLVDLTSAKSILFISQSYATGRSFLTLRQQLPNAQLFSPAFDINPPNEHQPIDQENWHKRGTGRALVWGEYLRINKYGRQGDLALSGVQDQLNSIEKLIGHTKP